MVREPSAIRFSTPLLERESMYEHRVFITEREMEFKNVPASAVFMMEQEELRWFPGRGDNVGLSYSAGYGEEL